MGVETAARNESAPVMLTTPCLKWSVWLDLHQHPAGYEPDALLLSYRPIMKWSDTPVLPRACLGPKPSEFAGSLVSE